jgi:hypothetical protein
VAESSCAPAISGRKKKENNIVNKSAGEQHFWKKLNFFPETARDELSLRNGDVQSVDL